MSATQRGPITHWRGWSATWDRQRSDEHCPDARRSGFTLLEVLIAIAIVALLALMGYRALSALSESESRLSAEATKWRTLDLFFARLEADLREAVPRPARSDAAREPAWLAAADATGNGALRVFARRSRICDRSRKRRAKTRLSIAQWQHRSAVLAGIRSAAQRRARRLRPALRRHAISAVAI